jgi:hypothetical protein
MESVFGNRRCNRDSRFRQFAFLLFLNPPSGLCILGFLLSGKASFDYAITLLAGGSGQGELEEPYRFPRWVFAFVD